MDRKIIPFPARKSNPIDAAAAQALFFPESEWKELVSTIPQALPSSPKSVY
jgi:hypothetical protein